MDGKIDGNMTDMELIGKGICPSCHSSHVEFELNGNMIKFHCKNCDNIKEFERGRPNGRK